MCTVLYLATPKAVRLVSYEQTHGMFEIRGTPPAGVPGCLSYPHVVDAGSHTGCSCGFPQQWHGISLPPDDYGDVPYSLEPRSKASFRAFVGFLSNTLERQHSCELYLVQYGDIDAPDSVSEIDFSELALPSFRLREGELIGVHYGKSNQDQVQ